MGSLFPGCQPDNALRTNTQLQLNSVEILADALIISGIESHIRKLIALSSNELHLNNR